MKQEQWQVWKKRVIGTKTSWMTRPEYVFDNIRQAELLAEAFKCQLSVVGVDIFHVGETPLGYEDPAE